ncbi:MAG: hypothetical protein K1W34_15345 [Lachnospiraceae bacterium]
MVDIINSSYEEFMQNILDKKLFLYGAGERTRTVYNYFCLRDKVEAIIDKNDKIKKFNGDNEEIPVITLEQFEQKADIVKSIILIIPTYVYSEIVEELDMHSKLDGLKCYIASLVQDYYEKQKFIFTQGVGQIPKKIHYCWFGRGEMSDQLKRCMESWNKFCPDYEILRWDENNYDVCSNQYMKEAYECKKWGYVPDYARLDIIYNEGGIYLDTDVELLAPIDVLLNDEMFCHFSSRFEVNFGSGFGAIKNHRLIKALRDYYKGHTFYNSDGTINTKPCAEYQNPVLEEFGFKLDNRYQKIEKVVIYPSEVSTPQGRSGIAKNFTSQTLMIHHAAATHRSVREKNIFLHRSEIENRIKGYEKR